MSESSPARSGQGRERTSPVTFYRQVVAELRKVVWPTRQEAGRITIVVLVVVLAISLILAGFDFVIAQLIKLLLSN